MRRPWSRLGSLPSRSAHFADRVPRFLDSSISGTMTGALTVYSATFMRYSLAVTPKNYLLFACHFINFNSQVTQGYRFQRYW